jgi:hypothetical protein
MQLLLVTIIVGILILHAIEAVASESEQNKPE